MTRWWGGPISGMMMQGASYSSMRNLSVLCCEPSWYWEWWPVSVWRRSSFLNASFSVLTTWSQSPVSEVHDVGAPVACWCAHLAKNACMMIMIMAWHAWAWHDMHECREYTKSWWAMFACRVLAMLYMACTCICVQVSLWFEYQIRHEWMTSF